MTPCLDVVNQGQTRFSRILGLDEEELVSLELIDDALIVPAGHYAFQVHVAGEETNDAVRNCARNFHQKIAIVADDGRVLSGFEARSHRHLIVAFRYNLGRESTGKSWLDTAN